MNNWKATVMKEEQRELFLLKAQKAVEDYYQENILQIEAHSLDDRAKQICRDIAREELEAQAKISFKAGQKSRDPEIKELRIEVGSIAFEKGKQAGIIQGKKEQYIVNWEHEGEAVKLAKSFGIREVVEKTKTSLEFAYKIAMVMDELKSSHTFFIIQQAFGDMDWTEAQDILNTVIEQAKLKEWERE